MLVVFSPIFAANTKIICGYNFVAHLIKKTVSVLPYCLFKVKLTIFGELCTLLLLKGYLQYKTIFLQECSP